MNTVATNRRDEAVGHGDETVPMTGSREKRYNSVLSRPLFCVGRAVDGKKKNREKFETTEWRRFSCGAHESSLACACEGRDAYA
jgi:hypothetical protein